LADRDGNRTGEIIVLLTTITDPTPTTPGIGAYLGLLPSEHSSGQSRVQGAITKTGNAHLRRLPVGAAWHHRTAYRPSVVLQCRWVHAFPSHRPAQACRVFGPPAYPRPPIHAGLPESPALSAAQVIDPDWRRL
jgi:hypothetical protein